MRCFTRRVSSSTWDKSPVATGLYFYRLHSGNVNLDLATFADYAPTSSALAALRGVIALEILIHPVQRYRRPLDAEVQQVDRLVQNGELVGVVLAEELLSVRASHRTRNPSRTPRRGPRGRGGVTSKNGFLRTLSATHYDLEEAGSHL